MNDAQCETYHNKAIKYSTALHAALNCSRPIQLQLNAYP